MIFQVCVIIWVYGHTLSVVFHTRHKINTLAGSRCGRPSTSAFDHPGLAQIEKEIDSLTLSIADSHKMNKCLLTLY